VLSDADLDRALLAQNRLAIQVNRDRSCHGDATDLAALADLQAALHGRSRLAEAADTGWLRSVLLERQNKASEAVHLLRGLRDDRDMARYGTAKPGLRGTITGRFPALAARLTDLLFETCASDAEIFDAIEWGKGRALADTQNAGHLPTSGKLANLIAGRRTHYLTFLQDDGAVFAALVTGDGTLMTKRIALDATEQVGVAHESMKASGGDPAAWQSFVAPLMAWLPGPCKAGPIRPDDIVLISPHGPLHSLPLHALPTADGLPLAPRVAVIRTHGAAAAAAALARTSGAPRRFVAVRAPNPRERDDPRHRDRFAQVLAPLRDAFEGEVLDAEAADADTLWAALKPDSVLHIMAHGDYHPSLRFYDRAGVLLAHDGRLPPARDPNALLGPHLFSPQALERRWAGDPERLCGTHVTLLACVSGHSRANLQGDAVGLEWAFLLGGADSVLSTHWHVSFSAASVFCATFYRAWLIERLSRAKAWQEAIRHQAVVFSDTSTSAAFSLSGQWT
jgi:hypothetical protein